MADNKMDPYASEVEAAKRAAAEKAYDQTSWSDWAGDVVGNALNTARSVLPTALGGKGEVGLTDMARGAYESGKNAITFPGDVISGKQPLFDENGRPLEQAVGRSFNAAATIGGAAAPIPRPPNSLGVFAGIKSRTADKNALTKAQIMESRGATPEEIWQETGWGRGAEQQWRYEIPDIGTSVDPNQFRKVVSKSGTPYNTTVLSDYLNHPELFEAYPEFKGMAVHETFSPGVNGYYLPRSEVGRVTNPYIALNLKNVSNADMQRSTLLHEIQHAIQQKEGFAPGSSPQNFPDETPNPMVAVYDRAFLNDPDLKFINAAHDSPEYRADIAGSNKLFTDKFQPLFKQLLADEDAGIDRTGEYKKLTEEYDELSNQMFPTLRKVNEAYKSLAQKGIPARRPKEFLEPTEAYRAVAGEVEARNVQERQNMVREGLRQLPPWKTQEKHHPYEGQIINWNDTSWRKGYAGRGRVVEGAVDEAISLAKRLMGGAPAKETVRGADLLKKTQGLTEDPFGYSKFAKPLSEMEYTVEKLPREPYKVLDPYDLVKQNATISGHISDRTAAGRNITNIGGTELVEPLKQRGGVDKAMKLTRDY